MGLTHENCTSRLGRVGRCANAAKCYHDSARQRRWCAYSSHEAAGRLLISTDRGSMQAAAWIAGKPHRQLQNTSSVRCGLDTIMR